MRNFCKNEDCPSSHELIDFSAGDLPKEEAGTIRQHLAICEFCEAEVEFYSRYPQTEFSSETTEIADIPEPLYQLAEALLKKRDTDNRSLDSLLKEKGLVIDKA